MHNPTSDIAHLPGDILRDMARNDAASPEYRRAAVELMIEKKFPQVNHPDLAVLVADVRRSRIAKQEVEAIVETAIEDEIEVHPDSGHGALRASVTTTSLDQPDLIDN